MIYTSHRKKYLIEKNFGRMVLPCLVFFFIFSFAYTSHAATLWEDTFDRANGAVGNGWAGVDGGSGEILNNMLHRTDSGAYRIFYNPAGGTLPADYYVTVTLPNSQVRSDYWGIVGRYLPPGSDMGSGNKIFWTNQGFMSSGVGHAEFSNDLSLTVTGGYPESWSLDQDHSVTLHYQDSTVTVYLDGEELGYFTDSTNDQVGTGIGFVGDNGNYYDIRVTDELPDYLPFGSDAIVPVVSNIFSTTTESDATVVWNTNELTRATIEYGLTDAYGSSVSTEAWTTDHLMTVSGLSGGTTYHYRIIATDFAGNVNQSSDYILSTIASGDAYWTDDFHRAYGAVGNGWVGVNSATGLISNDILERTDNSEYRILYNTVDGSLPQNYYVTIFVPQSTPDGTFWGLVGRYLPPGSGMGTGNKVFWMAEGAQSAGVGNAEFENTFSLTMTGGYPESWSEDRTHMVTLGYAGNTVTVYLDGEELGYFTDTTNNQTGTGIGLVGDGGGDFTVLGTKVTQALPVFLEAGAVPDTTPPTLSLISVNPAETTAAVSWTTDESADSVVEYGLTGTYGSTASSASLTASHSLALSGLTAGTTYHYRVSSTDASDNTATSDDATFTTDPEGSTPEEVVFHTTGEAFSAILTVADGAVIEWTFHDGTTSSSASPTKNYGTEGSRENRLTVTPWSALTEVNIGYDGGDDGTLPNPHLVQQNVTAVDGMEYMAPHLRVWASSQNPVTSLDFSNFISLHTIECFLCQQMTSVNLSNTPSLFRANFEDNNLAALDLSESPALEDLRGASNAYTEIVWGDVGENVWHICTRDNPQLNVNFPVMSHFPLLEELWIWNDNQTGTLAPTSTVLRSVQAYDNHYTAADFSGLFPVGRAAEVNVNGNELTSLDVSDSPGIMWLYARDNDLGRDAVDAVLHELATVAGGHNSGVLDLRGNTAPSATGFADVAILQARGWTVSVDASEDPIDILFLNTSAGTTTAAIYWNTSIDGTSLVEYGTDTGLGSSVSSDVMTSSHYIFLEGLLPDTAYVFRAISEDAEGNGIGTENSVFRTRSTGTTYWEDDFHRADGSVGNEWASVNSAVGTIEDEALLRDDTGAYRVLYHMTDETLPSDYFVTMAVPYVTTGRNFWGLVGRYLPPGSGDGTGTQIFWSDQGRENPVPGDPAWNSALAVTVTGGIPDTWNENRIHTVTLGYVGSTVTAYLDGQEYGTFEKSTNNTTGTGVGIVGEGNGGTYGILDVRVTSFLPDFSDLSGDAAPEVTSFVLPEMSDSLVVPISSFTATDDIGITGYLITESSDSPTYDDPMWNALVPTMFDFSTEGEKTLYAWAKDGSNNISSYAQDSVSVSLSDDNDAPMLVLVRGVDSPTRDTTPSISFSSSEAGTITYGGDCSSEVVFATSGDNEIIFRSMERGIHASCTITVTDSEENISNVLIIPSFEIIRSFGGGGGGGSAVSLSTGNRTALSSSMITSLLSLLRSFGTEESVIARVETILTQGKVYPEVVSVETCKTIFYRHISLGSKGEDVKMLQKILNRDEQTRIAVLGDGSKGNETGYFGLLTFDAVKRFQYLHADAILKPLGLSVPNGYVGERTLSLLRTMCEE
ncbi:MAG: hypothetical protein HGB03_00015 [Candidatus Yonathbacteria bacterium]|nr:hypothetical protein [Candidatus Yonathbacteria bacterium]NTW48065.1 hypothetical protein [Candidatus Yonathbacteria bacterium]